MNYTFKQLQDLVLGWMDEGDDQGVTRERVKDALADANIQRVADAKWPFMLTVPPLTFQLVPGQTVYDLDSTFDRPLYFKNTTKDEFLREVPNREFAEISVNAEANQQDFQIRGGKLQLLFTPSTADTIEYVFYKLPKILTADADEPDVPFPHSKILVWDALVAMKPYTTEADNIGDWQKKQESMENNLIQKFLIEGQTQAAHGQYVHSEDEDWQ